MSRSDLERKLRGLKAVADSGSGATDSEKKTAKRLIEEIEKRLKNCPYDSKPVEDEDFFQNIPDYFHIYINMPGSTISTADMNNEVSMSFDLSKKEIK